VNHSEITQAVRENPEIADRAREQMQSVMGRSATDPEFRQLLLSDSRSALGKHFGREIPETFNIAFVENRADATLVLPDPINPDAELSESELEAVAGGLYTLVPMVVIAICMIVDKANE
jgi:hypothetical protein